MPGNGVPTLPIQSVADFVDVAMAFRDELFAGRQFGKLMLRRDIVHDVFAGLVEAHSSQIKGLYDPLFVSSC